MLYPKKLRNTAMDDQINLPTDYEYYTEFYTPGSFNVKARTLDSDLFNAQRWNADRKQNPGISKQDPAYSKPRVHLPSQMDLSTGYMQTVMAYGNPKLDEHYIKIRTREDFVRAYVAENPDKRTPVDAALQTLAHTLIHEVSAEPLVVAYIHCGLYDVINIGS